MLNFPLFYGQATVGVGTVLIGDLGIAYTKGGGELGRALFFAVNVSLACDTSFFPHHLASTPTEHPRAHRYVFLDRDGRWFGVVLDYLREGLVTVPRNDPVQQRAVRREVAYYGVERLLPLLPDVSRQRTHVMFFGSVFLKHFLKKESYSGNAVALCDMRTGATLVHQVGFWMSQCCCSIDGVVYFGASSRPDDFVLDAIDSFAPGTGCWGHVALPVPVRPCPCQMYAVGRHAVIFGNSSATCDEVVQVSTAFAPLWVPCACPLCAGDSPGRPE